MALFYFHLCLQDDAQNKRLLKKHINHQNAASNSNTFALLHENGKGHREALCEAKLVWQAAMSKC